METAGSWKTVFDAWPSDLPRCGMIVTATSPEPIPFINFLCGEGFVIVERDKPDSSGARKVIIALAAITAVKLTLTDGMERLTPFVLGSQVAIRNAQPVRRTEELSYRQGLAQILGKTPMPTK